MNKDLLRAYQMLHHKASAPPLYRDEMPLAFQTLQRWRGQKQSHLLDFGGGGRQNLSKQHREYKNDFQLSRVFIITSSSHELCVSCEEVLIFSSAESTANTRKDPFSKLAHC